MRDGDTASAKVLIADQGYDSDAIRNDVENYGGAPVIPSRSCRKQDIPIDRFAYALRNQIERCFNKLKNARRLAA